MSVSVVKPAWGVITSSASCWENVAGCPLTVTAETFIAFCRSKLNRPSLPGSVTSAAITVVACSWFVSGV